MVGKSVHECWRPIGSEATFLVERLVELKETRLRFRVWGAWTIRNEIIAQLRSSTQWKSIIHLTQRTNLSAMLWSAAHAWQFMHSHKSLSGLRKGNDTCEDRLALFVNSFICYFGKAVTDSCQMRFKLKANAPTPGCAASSGPDGRTLQRGRFLDGRGTKYFHRCSGRLSTFPSPERSP